MFRVEGRAGSHQSVVFASAALEVETRGKQTNKLMSSPQGLGRSPFHSQECDKAQSQPGVCLYPSSSGSLGIAEEWDRDETSASSLVPKEGQ